MSLLLPKPVKPEKKRATTAKKITTATIARKSRPRKKRKGATAAMRVEADRLWSLLVRAREGCESPRPHTCKGVYQGAHGFGRGYHHTRWLLINGFKLCQAEHVYYTHRPLEWDEALKVLWGEDVYWELRRVALSIARPDVAAALAKLKEEAAARGIE